MTQREPGASRGVMVLSIVLVAALCGLGAALAGRLLYGDELLWRTGLGGSARTTPAWDEIPPENLLIAAVERPLPAYPPESLRRRATGVAVVSVLVGSSGAVLDAELLEAPDRWIGGEALSAARRWRFPSSNPEGFEGIGGRIIFYFSIDGRQGAVHLPTVEQDHAPARDVSNVERGRLRAP